MSEIRVDKIVSSSGLGAVEFTQGISVPAGQTISGVAQTAQGLTTTASVNTTGIITATRFSGDGSTLTGVASTENVRTNTLVVSGVSTFTGNVNVTGNLTVDGTTTTINSTTLTVDDKNIELGSTASPTDVSADGGGITLRGTTDKTLNWVDSTDSWTSSENVNLATGKTFKINGTDVLTSSAVLGKSVPSGTIVGTTDSQTLSSKTLCSGTLTGSLTAGGGTGSNGQFLQSTGSGVQWATSNGGAFAGCCVSNFLSCNTCAPNISSGANNFFVGCNAGLCNTSGNNNTFIGFCAGRSTTTACHNFLAGSCAGASITTGSYNNFVGRQAGSRNTTGTRNNIFGGYAGACLTGGQNNNFFGHQAGCNNLGGSDNNFLGYQAGTSNTSGGNNIAMGCFAGLFNTSGSNNVFMGLCSGWCTTTVCNNIFIGCQSGCSITGGCNVILGGFTGTGFTACTNHIFLSDGAGNNRLQLNNAGALGFAGACYGTAGQVLTSCGTSAAPVWADAGGGGSSAITACCTSNFLSSNTCAPNIDTKSPPSNNIFLGCNAGSCVTTGSNNNFFGCSAGFCNTTGSHNTFIGSCAGRNNITGCKNIFIGCYAGCLITGSNNAIFGGFCGRVQFALNMTTCSNHVAIADGQGCLKAVFNNCGSVAFGLGGNQYGDSGCFLQSNGSSSAPGWATPPNTFNICSNDAFLTCNLTSGFQALGVTNIRHSFFAGVCAGRYSGGANTSCHNTFIGKSAGFSNCGQYECFGQPAACATGSNNIAIGQESAFSNSSGSHNTFLGCRSGYCNIGGDHNFFAGACAGRDNTTGCSNVMIGQVVGVYNTTGRNNIFIGCKTGYYNTFGSNNIFLGTYAGGCNTGGNITGCNNIAIGCGAGTFDSPYNFGTTGGNNIIVIGNSAHTAAYVQVSWTIGSDARDKTNIIPIPVGRDFLKQLNPVQYQWKNRKTDGVTVEKPNYGFLAQDILALEDAPTIIVDDHDPEHLKVRESMIVPVLVKTVQELIEEVDALKEEVRILKGE